MAEAKTKPTKASVTQFMAKVSPAQRRLDALAVLKIMKRATGEKPVLWGPSIVGFGRSLIKYAGGRTVEWPMAGFSPRKTSLVFYGLRASPRHAALVARLGKCKTGGGCLYINTLADVDLSVLEELILTATEKIRSKRAAD